MWLLRHQEKFSRLEDESLTDECMDEKRVINLEQNYWLTQEIRQKMGENKISRTYMDDNDSVPCVDACSLFGQKTRAEQLGSNLNDSFLYLYSLIYTSGSSGSVICRNRIGRQDGFGHTIPYHIAKEITTGRNEGVYLQWTHRFTDIDTTLCEIHVDIVGKKVFWFETYRFHIQNQNDMVKESWQEIRRSGEI